jgi:hypothetical protein
VQYAVGPDISEAVSDLLQTITPELQAQWAASTPRDWANESFAISEAATTRYCEMRGLSCGSTGQAVAINADYLNENEGVVKDQLRKAGVRLAHLLDEVFAR